MSPMLQVEGRVWCVREELLPVLARLDGTVIDAAAHGAEFESRAEADTVDSVATIPLKGVLMPGAGGFFEMLLGLGGGLDSFRRNLDRAVADDSVKRIVIDVDSPGGVVDLIPETADAVWKARKAKPVTAMVNTLAASAAYWIASQADEIVSTPSGEAGSIGVYSIHRDMSAMFDQSGVVHTIVSAGRYKTEANPFEELDDEAQAFLQQGVDDYYSMFVSAVARGRGVTTDAVRKGYGEGRVLTAKRAVSAGLVDRIATFDEVVRKARRDRASASEIAAVFDVPEELLVTVGGRQLRVPATAENRRRISGVPDLFRAGDHHEKEEAADAG
jgi:capsid assembly protease